MNRFEDVIWMELTCDLEDNDMFVTLTLKRKDIDPLSFIGEAITIEAGESRGVFKIDYHMSSEDLVRGPTHHYSIKRVYQYVEQKV